MHIDKYGIPETGIPNVYFYYFFFECNRTPSGKKMVNRVQVATASKVQSIMCRAFRPAGHPSFRQIH